MASFGVGVSMSSLLRRRFGFGCRSSKIFKYAIRSAHAHQTSDLSKVDVDTILRRNEKSFLIGSGSIHSYDTNQLPANSPCEDNYAEAKCLTTDAWLFGVFDGHAGYSCSRAVARRLYDYLAVCLLPRLALMNLEQNFRDNLVQFSQCSSDVELEDVYKTRHVLNLQRFVHHCIENFDSLSNVRRAFQISFRAFDDDLSLDAQPDAMGVVSAAHVSLVTSGSCACVAHVKGHNLHMANVGDSVAVLGVCNDDGVWSARQLTKEHCIENPDEVKRIRNEHPNKESTSVLRGGRLLGQLYPLRAFGDVRFKWSAEKQKLVLEPFLKESVLPPGFETPPYLSAQPEVFYHRLTPNDKFLVIGSDGLFEILTPEKIVRLVSDHMIGRQTLSPYNPSPETPFGCILEELRIRKAGEAKKPMDVNSATHLIRNALGGDRSDGIKQFTNLASTLSLGEGKKARGSRDDITITVVYFDPVYLASEEPADQR